MRRDEVDICRDNKLCYFGRIFDFRPRRCSGRSGSETVDPESDIEGNDRQLMDM